MSVEFLYVFGIQLQPAFHVCHRTFFVTVQQLGPAALMVGLGKVGVQFDGFVKQFDGFGQLFLADVQLPQIEERLFVEGVQLCDMEIVGFRFALGAGCFFYFSAEQYGAFVVRVSAAMDGLKVAEAIGKQ